MQSDDITELLKSLYERNEAYHDVKERVVWLAGTIYLTFSALLIAWYLRLPSKNVLSRFLTSFVKPWHIIASLSAIFVLTGAFIIRQTVEKARSAVITEQYMKVVADVSNKSYKDLKRAHKF
jgi:predicted Co/Zn/Cd cation transporter (cation efflux family)